MNAHFSPQIYNKNLLNNKKININNNNNNYEKYDSETFLFHQKICNRKLKKKIENMIKENENKFIDKCFFKISTFNVPYYEVDIVLVPESYEAYINKRNKIRSKKKKRKLLKIINLEFIWKNKNIIDFNNDEKKNLRFKLLFL